MNQGKSTHSDEERCIFGTWVVDEVRRVVEMGYGLMDVFAFWEYEVTWFDKVANTGGLCAQFVNMLLKFKQESSGYPPGFKVKTTRTDTLRTIGAQRELP